MILKLLNKNIENLIIKEIESKEYEQLFLLHRNNKDYYALFNSEEVSWSQVLKGLEQLPPDVPKSHKHYLGIYLDKELLACIDLLEKYPDDNTLYLGLLMIDIKNKKRGLGTQIINAVIDSSKDIGYKRIKLACLVNNKEGYAFWLKCGFHETECKITNDFGNEEKELIIMERII